MKRLISVAVSVALLVFIYWRIDIGKIWGVLSTVHPVWLSAALGILAGPLLLSAWRLERMVPKSVGIGFAESLRLILCASVLNTFLPSKAGDLAKSWFFRQRGHLAGSLALAMVLFEKACDMLALLVWCVFGLVMISGGGVVLLVLGLFVGGGLGAGLLMLSSLRFARLLFGAARSSLPPRFGDKIGGIEESWSEMHSYFWADRGRLALLAVVSLAIWMIHLVSVWLFIRSLGVAVPVVDSLALTPLSLLAGLLPLTFAGIGTRDAAVLYFYQDYLSAPQCAAVGVFMTVRYLVLGIAGLPFIGEMAGRKNGSGTVQQ